MGNTELMNTNGLGKLGVTRMDGRLRNRRSLCADEQVCSNAVISVKKKLLQWPASLEIGRYTSK